MNIAQYIDHTFLKPDGTFEHINRLISEAVENHFYAVCVNPVFASYCSRKLRKTGIKLAVVAGFPLGAGTVDAKVFEAQHAVRHGADEIDMVMSIGHLKSGDYAYVRDEIASVKRAIGGNVLKVIVETCLLSEEEKKTALKCCIEGNADFIKTSTGFSTGGAQIGDIEMFKALGNGNIKIKASGGIRNRKQALSMIEAGADRIGASASVSIVRES